MDEIRRRDTNLFLKEFFSGSRIVLTVFLILVTFALARPGVQIRAPLVAVFWLIFLGLSAWTAFKASVTKRFELTKYDSLWQSCLERHERFGAALKQLSKRGIADLQELPETIEGLLQGLYRALRRADIVAGEVAKSEDWLVRQPRFSHQQSSDLQAQELYRLADNNIAEYRQHYQGIMASVERTEAQAHVFTTTLDTLRMKMLGYRLVGRETETPTQEFLIALTEARMQLDSIDKALDELELTPFPKTISIIPEPGQFSEEQEAQIEEQS